MASEAEVEAGARAIILANGFPVDRFDSWWPRQIAFHREMEAEHGDDWRNSRSLVTDAMRSSRAVLEVARPAPAGEAALREEVAVLVDAAEVQQARFRRLLVAFHDAIRRPLGVTPDSGEEFYDWRMAEAAEEVRPRAGTTEGALSQISSSDEGEKRDTETPPP